MVIECNWGHVARTLTHYPCPPVEPRVVLAIICGKWLILGHVSAQFGNVVPPSWLVVLCHKEDKFCRDTVGDSGAGGGTDEGRLIHL